MNKLADFYQLGVKLALERLGLLKEAAGMGAPASVQSVMPASTGTGAMPAPAAPFGGSQRVSIPQLQSKFDAGGAARPAAMPAMKSPLRV